MEACNGKINSGKKNGSEIAEHPEMEEGGNTPAGGRILTSKGSTNSMDTENVNNGADDRVLHPDKLGGAAKETSGGILSKGNANGESAQSINLNDGDDATHVLCY